MRTTHKVASMAIAAGLALSMSACGDAGGVEQIEQNMAANLDGRGPINYVQGRDNQGIVRPMIDKWNAAHPGEEVRFIEQTDDANQQRDDLVKNFQVQNGGYDVVSVDVVWTSEFAARGWLQPLENEMEVSTEGMIQSTIDGATYNDTLYAAPTSSDGGILWYRKDLVPEAPKTWDEMMGMCDIAKQNSMDCYAGQYDLYEGLTVNAGEAINSRGGHFLNENGQPDVDTEGAREGLQLLADAYADGNIPNAAITYKEEQGRASFENGDLLFMRNWPYVYNLLNGEGSKVAGKFGMAPLPGKDGVGTSTLGGHSAAINVYSEHKATARDFVAYMASEETQKQSAINGALAPVSSSIYDDPDAIAELPYLPVLKTSIENAVPRPVTPFYPGVTRAIQENSYAAIRGEKDVDTAVSDMQSAMAAATSGS